MTRVIHAVPVGDQAFYALNLETGEQAVVITKGTKDPDRILDFFGERFVMGMEHWPDNVRTRNVRTTHK